MMKDPTKKNEKKHVVVPVKYEMWFSLRKVSYEKQISMNSLIRSAIERIIKKHEKTVDV